MHLCMNMVTKNKLIVSFSGIFNENGTRDGASTNAMFT